MFEKPFNPVTRPVVLRREGRVMYMKLVDGGRLCTGVKERVILVTELITFFSTEVVRDSIVP